MPSLPKLKSSIPNPCFRWEFEVVMLGTGRASDCSKAVLVAYSNALNIANLLAAEICSSPFECNHRIIQINGVQVERCDPIGDELEAVVRLAIKFGCGS